MKYELTFPKLDGSLILEYDDDTGILVQYNLNANIGDGQVGWFCSNFPFSMKVFDVYRQAGVKFSLDEIQETPTFEAFYNNYPKKEQKQDAIKVWAKLSDTEQRAAIKHLRNYKNQLIREQWRSPLLPATYLNKKMWND